MQVVRIDACNPGPMTGEGNHTYLVVSDDGAAVLVDAGVGDPRHLAELAERLREGQAALRDVIVTHGHPDHAEGAAAIARAYPDATFWKYPWPEQDGRFDVRWHRVADGDVMPVGAHDRLTILHTPGHSPDHVAIWDEASRTAFTGDLVVQGSSVMIHASRGGRLAEYLQSLTRLRALDPRTLLPAHGPQVDRPDEVLAGYIAHRLERERQVADALGAGAASVRAIAESIYHGLQPALVAAAQENVRAHLEKLRDDGRVVEDGDRWTLRG